MTKDPFARALNYAYRLLAVKDRTEKEIKKRLYDKGYKSENVVRIVSSFKENGLIDDKRFATKWVRDSFSIRPRGPLAIKGDLLKKGLDVSLVEDALADPESGYNEYEAALSLAKKRRKGAEGLYGYLARRGFSFDVINEIIDNL